MVSTPIRFAAAALALAGGAAWAHGMGGRGGMQHDGAMQHDGGCMMASTAMPQHDATRGSHEAMMGGHQGGHQGGPMAMMHGMSHGQAMQQHRHGMTPAPRAGSPAGDASKP